LERHTLWCTLTFKRYSLRHITESSCWTGVIPRPVLHIRSILHEYTRSCKLNAPVGAMTSPTMQAEYPHWNNDPFPVMQFSTTRKSRNRQTWTSQ